MGCGEGWGTDILARWAKSVVGVDNDKEVIDQARKVYRRRNLRFINTDWGGLGDSGFDVVVALQIIEHVEEVEEFVGRLRSLLNRGGVVIVSTPNKLTQSVNENPYHEREFSAVELESLFGQYFGDIGVFGLFGDEKFVELERRRKRNIDVLYGLDFLKIRIILPRGIWCKLFDWGTWVNRVLVRLLLGGSESGIGIDSFEIRGDTDGAVDLIVVAK